MALTDPEVAGRGRGNQHFNNFEKQVGAAEHDEFLGNAELEAAADAPQSGEEEEETQKGEQTGHAKQELAEERDEVIGEGAEAGVGGGSKMISASE